MSTWFTATDETRLVNAWRDAPVENAEVCAFILDAARDQVLNYAPDTAPTPPGGVVETVSFVAPVESAAKGTTAYGILTRYMGGVATVEITATNPTAAAVNNPAWTITDDPEYLMDNNVEYGIEGSQNWLVAWTTGVGLQVQILGGFPAGETRSIRTAVALDNPGVYVPSRYVYAQLQQAKNLLMAGSVARGGEYGEGEFSFEPRPLDKAIKNIIRPVDGKPHVL